MTEPACIELRDLHLSRNRRKLLNGVSITLAPESLTVILGANGAGKSLLLRVMHGLLKPDSGDILIDGEPLETRHRKDQAMVFQKPVLLRRSVQANLDYVLQGPAARRSEQIDELLRAVKLDIRRNQSARSLSGGEQQRLALARAMALKPRVLFLDEPTANLDPASILLIEQLVQRLRKGGCKIVFVTHDIAQARRLASDVLFMHQGQVLEQSDNIAFFTAPQTPAAKAHVDGRLYM